MMNEFDEFRLQAMLGDQDQDLAKPDVGKIHEVLALLTYSDVLLILAFMLFAGARFQ